MSHPVKKKAPRAAYRLDAANVAGLTTLMNTQHVKPGVNLGDAEKKIMGKSGSGAGQKRADGDPVQIYAAEMRQLMDELGIDLLEEGGAPPLPEKTAFGAAKSAPAKSAPDPHARLAASAVASPAAPLAATPAAGRTPVRPPASRPRAADLVDEIDLDSILPPAPPREEQPRERPPRERPPRERQPRERPPREGSPADFDLNSFTVGTGEGAAATAAPEDDGDDGDDGDEGDSESDEGDEGDDCDCDSECPSECDCDCHFSSDDEGDSDDSSDGDDDEVNATIARFGGDVGLDSAEKRGARRHRVHMIEPVGALPSATDRRRPSGHITGEQERRQDINSVLADIRKETRTTFGMEKERLQDSKAMKLNKIDQLRASLKEQQIDCKDVSMPTLESDIREIDAVLYNLTLRNDAYRYSSVAEEFILGAAEFVETVLDGSRAIPLVGWKPDYTGYSATVNAKLHRMRYETSQIVGDFVKKHNIGNGIRMGIELLPGFILYPRHQRKQQGQPGLSSEPHVADARYAYAAIRSSDEPGRLAEAREL